MAEQWSVLLRNQDGSSNPNAKTLVAKVAPENLHFLQQLGVEGPGEIDFEISLGAEDDDGRKIVRPGFIGPYRTDFELRLAGQANPLMAGMVTSYGGAEAGEEHVKISGKDWLHYLERRCWPYDATLSYRNWPEGFRFKVQGAEVAQTVKDMLETVRDVSPNWPGPPAGNSYSLNFTIDVDNTGKTHNYEIAPFESQSMYELVKTLAEADKSVGGFDFYMTWNKVFRLVYPEIGDPDNPVIFLNVDPETLHANMISLGQTNTGPDCTHVLGVGAGSSTKQGGVNKHFRHNSQIFRRLDKVSDFGDVKDLNALEGMTSSVLSFGANPVHEVPITVDPSQVPGFWSRVRPGLYASVAYDLGYARLPNESGFPQRIVSMDRTVDNDGNELAVVGTNQHFDVSANAGLDDW